jgi:bifunctional DNase/RNase
VDVKIKLRVQGLTSNQIQSCTYALILAEEKGQRRIPIVIGVSEAQSIAIALEHIMPPRPLTHDLFCALCKALDAQLLEIYIYKFEEGIFFSELIFERNGRQIRIDSRTSDAIAIALRAKCDIYIKESVIQECGIELDDASAPDTDGNDATCVIGPENIKDDAHLKKWLSMLDDGNLQSRLDEAIANEFYEYAKMYRDELRRREIKRGEKKDD